MRDQQAEGPEVMTTGFFWDERCFWHWGGNYALTLPVGGHVQPMVAGGLPENPETKRRLKNLMDLTGLSGDLAMQSAAPSSWEDMARVHPEHYLREFRDLSAQGGGELGPRAPFSQGGFEIAALSAGLTQAAIAAVLKGELKNAYALSRPPGHHCLPEFPNGFCLLANIAIGIEAAFAAGLANRIAVIDWDVHHGNGTEGIFYDREDVLAISVHQEFNYPLDSGAAEDIGQGAGEGFNMNIPLPPGAGHVAYMDVMERLIVPALDRYKPDLIVIACGFDAAPFDPLSRMMATAETFRLMTRAVMEAADRHCQGRLMMAHEGGYSEVYVPFCGHAVLEEMSGSKNTAPDPQEAILRTRQPNARADAFYRTEVDRFVAHFTETGFFPPSP